MGTARELNARGWRCAGASASDHNRAMPDIASFPQPATAPLAARRPLHVLPGTPAADLAPSRCCHTNIRGRRPPATACKSARRRRVRAARERRPGRKRCTVVVHNSEGAVHNGVR